jgi:predicted Zn finger-like uncharacterized protein
MQIVCPNCRTSYRVDASAMGAGGRSVRCARCQTVWFAANTAALAEISASHRAEMAQFAATGEAADIENWPEPGAAASTEDAAVEPEGAPFASVDVGFVPDAPSVAPYEGSAAEDRAKPETPQIDAAPIEVAQAEDIETVAARRALERDRRRRFSWPFSWLITTVGALLLLNAGLIIWRGEVVRIAPQTASLYAAMGLPVNLRGLVIADVTAVMRLSDGVPVLLVQGQIISAARHTVEVPRLRFAVRNGNGTEIYSWTALPGRSLLSPDEALAFQSRLAAPPQETREVLVRFFNRHDLAASTQ